MAEIKTVKRIFSYNSLSLQDPDPEMNPEEVKGFYSSIYPELTQAVVEGPEYDDDGNITYEFKKAIGTKGCMDKNPRLNIENIIKVTESRIPERERHPNLFYYEIRHGDDWEPSTIEKKVIVNFWGTNITDTPLQLDDRMEDEDGMPDYLYLTFQKRNLLMSLAVQ